jgi:hypothetical protein
MKRLEPAPDSAPPYHARDLNGLGEALQLHQAQIRILEEVAREPARARINGQTTGLGQGLEAGSKVGRFADHATLLRGPGADEIADHDQASRDPDPN